MLDTNGRPVDRLLIKNVENFYFLFDGFPYVISPAFSTPTFSAPPNGPIITLSLAELIVHSKLLNYTVVLDGFTLAGSFPNNGVHSS